MHAYNNKGEYVKHQRLIVVLVAALAMSVPAFAQEDQKTVAMFKQSDIFINLSSTGTGAGFKIHFPTNNQDVRYSLGLQISGVRGENEYTYYDPYSYYPRKGGSNYFTLIVPMTVGVKKRLWREKIDPSIRPFVALDAGPVYGVAFPRLHGIGRSVNKGQGQITGGAYLGIGVEFGNEDERTYGVTIGVHVFGFPETLGEKANYNGFDLRLNFLNLF